ncbi:hypothetical protein K523DRAFT_92803 [Schizophyllum commune Tattone D]|nr:hypothetical protein K523DRAFT_92803 [Schizophyllum commune Tattone D]
MLSPQCVEILYGFPSFQIHSDRVRMEVSTVDSQRSSILECLFVGQTAHTLVKWGLKAA